MVLAPFTLPAGGLIVCVNESAKTCSVAADNDDGLADPALDVVDIAAVGAAEGVDEVDEVGAKVAQHVHEAGGSAEGHDHGWVLD